jgi:chromosome partitioning protein
MIIYIKNNKGGVGKSTISRNIAHGFALKNIKVALVSFDSQNDSLILLGREFEDSKGFKHFSQHGGDIKIKIRENLNYYPLETNSIGSALSDKIKQSIHSLDEKYDLVIIDGAPSKDDVLSKIALEVADQIIIPVLLDILSIKAIKRLQETLPVEKVSCIVPNKFRRTKDEKEIYEALVRFFSGTQVCVTFPIPQSAFESGLGLKGRSMYDTRCKKAEKSKEVYDEIMEVITSWA